MRVCGSCYKICDPVPDCLDTLSVSTLIINEGITIKITDKFNNTYIFRVLTDQLGVAVLDLDSEIMPSALLNRYAGEFRLTVENNGALIPFVVDNTEYDCLTFAVGNVVGADDGYLIDVYGIITNSGYY
jgi:hypothetical protein